MTLTEPRTWLISGANTGLGLALTEQAVSKGERIVAAMRTPSKAPASLLNNPNVVILPLDLSWNQQKINTFIQDAVAVWGRLDVVVNMAGYIYSGAIEEST